MNIQIIDSIDYDSALKLQTEEKERVKAEQSTGTIFLLEHNPSVITFGRHADRNNLLVRKDIIEGRGYQVREVSRGGDITVHEPGQVLGYIVLPLRSGSVRTFIESIMISIRDSLLKEFGLGTEYIEKKAGLWVAGKKICSVGFDLRGRVSMHGFALNVNNTLEGFGYVIPCGLAGVSMTTISKETGKDVKTRDIKLLLADTFRHKRSFI